MELDRFAFDVDLALGRFMNAGKSFDQGGFASAVIAKQAVGFAKGNLEIYATECSERTEPFEQSFDAQIRISHIRYLL